MVAVCNVLYLWEIEFFQRGHLASLPAILGRMAMGAVQGNGQEGWKGCSTQGAFLPPIQTFIQ